MHLLWKNEKGFKASNRIYRLNVGNRIDRDHQAALHLKGYGEMYLKQQSAG